MIVVSDCTASSCDIKPALANVDEFLYISPRPSTSSSKAGIAPPILAIPLVTSTTLELVSLPKSCICERILSRAVPCTPVIADNCDNAWPNSADFCTACCDTSTNSFTAIPAAATPAVAATAPAVNEPPITPPKVSIIEEAPEKPALSKDLDIREPISGILKPLVSIFTSPRLDFILSCIFFNSLNLEIAESRSFFIFRPIDDSRVAESSCSYAYVKSRTLLLELFSVLLKFCIEAFACAVSADILIFTLFLPIVWL